MIMIPRYARDLNTEEIQFVINRAKEYWWVPSELVIGAEMLYATPTSVLIFRKGECLKAIDVKDVYEDGDVAFAELNEIYSRITTT